MSTSHLPKPNRRPGGRTAEVGARIHQAIIDLIIEKGIEACTFSAVAERAGVERSTLYRRFPNRWDAIIDAFLNIAGADVTPEATGSFAGDLRSVLRKLRDILETPLGPAVVSVAAALRARPDAEYSRDYFLRRMQQIDPMYDAAVERGELSSEADRELIKSMAAGSLYHRIFLAGRTADDAFIDAVVAGIARAFGSSEVTEVSSPANIP